MIAETLGSDIILDAGAKLGGASSTFTDDVFSIFEDKIVRIYSKTQSGGYSDNGEKLTEHGSITADLQPYSGEGHNVDTALRADYGVEISKLYTLYCPVNSIVAEGRYAEYNGVQYLITAVCVWDFGLECMLKRVNP